MGKGAGSREGGEKMSLPVLPTKATTLESADVRSAPDMNPLAISRQPSDTDTDTDANTDEESFELPELTPQQFAFTTSTHYRSSSLLVKREFGLSDDDVVFLNEMDRAVFGGMITLHGYIAALREEFPRLDAKEKDRLISELLAYRFVPFDGSLSPNAQEAAQKAGIAMPARIPYYRIYDAPLTFRGAAHEVARMAGFTLVGPAQERIRDLIISRNKGIRNEAQVLDQLRRSAEQGGIGLSEEVAVAAQSAIEDLLGRAQLMGEEEYANWLNSKIHAVPSAASSTAQSSAEAPSTLHKDEEDEIRTIVARMPAQPIRRDTTLEVAVRAVADRLTWRSSDPYLQSRLENVISTRLRDVRSKNEVFIKLMRDEKVGGLGIDRKRAEEVTDEIEKGYVEFRGAIAQEEEYRIKEQLTDQQRKIEERKRREAEEHARWYEEKVKQRQGVTDQQKSTLEKLRTVVAHGMTTPISVPMHPVEEKAQAKERAQFGELVPASPAIPKSVAPSPPEPQVSQQSPVTSSALKTPSVRDVPVAPVVKVSAETERMRKTAQGSRPKIEDIAAPKTSASSSSTALAGPLQEIGNMTLEHFRRISKDPKLAAKRVQDLVALLGEESFNRRTAGIQAWRSSPLQKQYLSLMTESFAAKMPVQKLVDSKQGSKADFPTAEEISAIIELNGILKL